MPQTQSGCQTGADTSKLVQAQDAPKKASRSKANTSALPPGAKGDAGPERNGKRKSSSNEDASPDNKENADPGALNAHPPAKKAKNGKEAGQPAWKKDAKESQCAEPQHQKPRLTTPDLEFDFDRTQLRDPRPTPGRKARPRYESMDLKQESSIQSYPPPSPLNRENREIAMRFENEFYVPKPEKPKGRLNAFQKDEVFREKSLLDPRASFHDLYVCHKKGPDGSPTYDPAGFELDWNKVNAWMKPQTYNKNAMVRGMEKRLMQKASEDEQIAEIFFGTGGRPDKNQELSVTDHVRDQISKDIGVPWHQIGVKEANIWKAKGFKEVKFDQWWHEPNEVEKKRMMKMQRSASLRKDL